MYRATTISIFLLLTPLLLTVPACQENSSAPDPLPTEAETTDQMVPTVPPDQAQLMEVWNVAQQTSWDVISAMVDPATGGIVAGQPSSWPPGYLFSVALAPGALPGSTSIRVKIKVPVYDAEPPHDRDFAVYGLEPDVTLSRPARVQFCFPPNLEPSDHYIKYCIFAVSEDPLVLSFSDLARIRADSTDQHTNITFTTTHFSNWVVENGKGGRSKSSPEGGHFPDLYDHY